MDRFSRGRDPEQGHAPPWNARGAFRAGRRGGVRARQREQPPSPRNPCVAAGLNEAGLATLLFDLLTADEELDRRNVFDVSLLGRPAGRGDELARDRARAARGLPVGYFGASTGAAAALWAAAELGTRPAVVSRGGRPDLAAERLGWVRAPTLLIVGGLRRSRSRAQPLGARAAVRSRRAARSSRGPRISSRSRARSRR